MKYIQFCVLAILVAAGSFSCQKEVSFENSANIAAGSLQSDATLECLPKTIAGAYIVGKLLTDSNFIQVDINVSAIGSYKISTDTVNGYSFSSTGVFTTTGINTIKLKSKGTPLASEIDPFIIIFDSTFCLVQVSVLPATAGLPAAFTLQGSPSSCLNFAVSGTYSKSVALNSSNKVTIEVNVTSIGTYNISTTASNGMTFSTNGAFAATGIQPVTLNGSGTPSNTGTITVPVTAGSTTCSFTLDVVGAATGTLGGSPSACTVATVNGTYTQGTALTSANTVQIQVNVATTGAYTITTNTVSGISFTKSGSFAATGVQNIVLDGSGTPSASGVTTFTITFGSSSCTFPVTINAGTRPPPLGTYFWKFTEGGFTYQGSIDDATLIANPSPLGTISIFAFFGSTVSSDTVLNIGFTDFGGGITTNETYTTTSASAIFQVNDANGGILYMADGSTSGANMTIKITGHNTTTKVIDGTFSGTAKNSSGVTKTITNGQFKVQYP